MFGLDSGIVIASSGFITYLVHRSPAVHHIQRSSMGGGGIGSDWDMEKCELTMVSTLLGTDENNIVFSKP